MEPKTDTPIGIAPELDKESRDLILLARTLKSGILEITVNDAKPTYCEVRYPDMLNRQAMGTYPLSADERNLLSTIRFVRFGRVVLSIEETTGHYKILGDTVQKFKCGNISFSEWI